MDDDCTTYQNLQTPSQSKVGKLPEDWPFPCIKKLADPGHCGKSYANGLYKLANARMSISRMTKQMAANALR